MVSPCNTGTCLIATLIKAFCNLSLFSSRKSFHNESTVLSSSGCLWLLSSTFASTSTALNNAPSAEDLGNSFLGFGDADGDAVVSLTTCAGSAAGTAFAIGVSAGVSFGTSTITAGVAATGITLVVVDFFLDLYHSSSAFSFFFHPTTRPVYFLFVC